MSNQVVLEAAKKWREEAQREQVEAALRLLEESAVSKHKHPEPEFVPESAPEAPPQGREPVEHKVGDRVKVHPRHTVHAGVQGKVVSVDPRHGMACVDDGKGKVREWFRHEELEPAS